MSSSGPPSYATCRDAWSEITPATAYSDICWYGYDVWLFSSAWDTEPDGHCAFNQITYRIDSNGDGTWSEWHYRTAITACGNGTGASTGWWRARYRTRDLAIRACADYCDGIFR